jgi:outer membrane lipoprotein-sorting protein
MKKAFLLIFTALFLSGCQQVSEEIDKTRAEAEKTITETANSIETTKNQVLETKAKIDEKVTQAQDAARAVQKLVQ